MKATLAQLKLLFKRKSFVLTLTFTMAISIFMFIVNCIGYYNDDLTHVQAGKYLYIGGDYLNLSSFVELYHLILPLIAVLPFADTFFEEKKNKTTELCIIRTSNRKYYFSKIFVVFFSGFIVNFIPLLTNMLLNFIAFPLNSAIDATNLSAHESYLFLTAIQHMIFENLFAKNIYIYNLVFMFLLCASAGLMAVIVYQFSYFYDNNRILLNCSLFGIYVMLYLILSTFGLREFNLSNYIISSKFFCDQSIRGLIVVFTLLTLAAFLPILFTKKKLDDCYD